MSFGISDERLRFDFSHQIIHLAKLRCGAGTLISLELNISIPYRPARAAMLFQNPGDVFHRHGIVLES